MRKCDDCELKRTPKKKECIDCLKASLTTTELDLENLKGYVDNNEKAIIELNEKVEFMRHCLEYLMGHYVTGEGAYYKASILSLLRDLEKMRPEEIDKNKQEDREILISRKPGEEDRQK